MTTIFSPSQLTILIHNLNPHANPVTLEKRKSLLTSNRIIYIKDLIASGALELGRKSKLISQLYQKGFISLNFIEFNNSEYVKFLEGFQLNRKILAVSLIISMTKRI
jgi:hypothetical protein